jgi:hypothetical protein
VPEPLIDPAAALPYTVALSATDALDVHLEAACALGEAPAWFARDDVSAAGSIRSYASGRLPLDGGHRLVEWRRIGASYGSASAGGNA